MMTFFDTKHEDGIKVSSLKSIFAILKKFWLLTGRGKLDLKVPLLLENFKKWTKVHVVKKSHVYTKQHLRQLHQMPDDPYLLIRKVHNVLGVNVLARLAEITNLTFEDVERLANENGRAYYRIKVDRLKNVESRVEGMDSMNSYFVTGNLEVDCLDRYIACFETRVGRFFRKLKSTRSGVIVATNQVIGRNTLAKYPSDVARALELPDHEKFTSHALRRTGMTFMAESGMSLVEIMNTSGHRSATVAQQYISHSSLQKRKASEALTVSTATAKSADQNFVPTASSAPTTVANTLQHPQPTGQQQVVIHLSGTFNIGGSMSVHSSGVEEVRRDVGESSNV